MIMSETGIQQEVVELERQLQAKKEELARRQEQGEIQEIPDDKSTLHEVVGERIHEGAPSGSSPAADDTQTSPQVTPSPTVSTPAYLTDEFKEKIQEYVNLAFEKGIDMAVVQVRASGNAALIDAFHDALVDELYSYLVEHGKLKEI